MRGEIGARSLQTLFPQGAAILSQGEPMSRVGVVISGLVKLSLMDEGGDEHLLQLLHAGDLVGDPLAEECATSWEAATDVELCWMAPAALTGVLRGNPSGYRAYLDAVLRQVHEQRFAQMSARGRNSLQRVAYWLAAQTAEPAADRVHILLSRRDLASLLDMSVETLCRMLHQLADRGAIRLEQSDVIEVLDSGRLRMLARDQDARLRETLLTEGWEWGARALGATPASLAEAEPARRKAPEGRVG